MYIKNNNLNIRYTDIPSENLIFPIQRIKDSLKSDAYNKIYQIDHCLDINKIDISNLSSNDLKGIFTKITLLYGNWICNFNCPNYCYTKQFKTEKLPISTIENVIQEGVSLGAQFTYWPGVGEITLLKEFWEILEYQSRINLPAIVFTNGSIFIDEKLCFSVLGISCTELLERISKLNNVYFYIKMWSTDPDQARHMTGTSLTRKYPYSTYRGINCPKAFKVLHQLVGSRIGFQCMVTQRNFTDYLNNILPFCINENISLFAEPIILSGEASNNPIAKSEVLSTEQIGLINNTLSSGATYCNKRQYGELIVIGNKITPGIAIPARNEDHILNLDGSMNSLHSIYFNTYFRNKRKESDLINGCLCREYWNDNYVISK